MKYLGMLTVLVAISIGLSPLSGEAANPCFSTLTTGMKIHDPSVKFEGAFHDVDFEVCPQGPSSETGVWLRLLAITAGSLLDCSNPPIFFFDGGPVA